MASLVLHQPAHLVVVEVRDIIPRYLAPVAINDATTRIVAGRAEMRFSLSRFIGTPERQITPKVDPNQFCFRDTQSGQCACQSIDLWGLRRRPVAAAPPESRISLMEQFDLPMSGYASGGPADRPEALPDDIANVS
jgi:hypothetical protein